MNLIKLSAIDSTNNYLKQFSNEVALPNFTVVTTKHQTKGKGQMGNSWYSEKGKNLTFSVLVNNLNLNVSKQAYLNFAISVALHNVLSNYLPNITIKWPNDILSPHGKFCGILIENTVLNNKIVKSIIGIGVNVNQTSFPKAINSITSLKKELHKSSNLEDLLIKIVTEIEKQIDGLINKNYLDLKTCYLQNLFKYETIATYKTKKTTFLGKIINVTDKGLLQIMLVNNKEVKQFDLKEVSFIDQ